MLVVTTIEITKGFQTWKDMVKASGEKMKEYGMTMVFAGPQADDETKLHAVIRFDSMEALKKFQADKELTQRRIEAGVKVETGTFTIVSDESLLNYPTTISRHE